MSPDSRSSRVPHSILGDTLFVENAR